MRKPLPSNNPPVINSAHFHGELLSIRYLETQLCSRQTRRPSPLGSKSCSVCNVSSTHRHMARLVAQTGFLGGDGVLAESWKGGSYLGAHSSSGALGGPSIVTPAHSPAHTLSSPIHGAANHSATWGRDLGVILMHLCPS